MSGKRWLLYGVFGLVFYLLFLVIFLPASWLAWGVNRYSQGLARLDPIAGSLWSGSGRLVIYYPPTVPHDLGVTEWNLNPFWVFAGRVQIHLKTVAQDTSIDTTVRMGLGRFHLAGTAVSLPAQSVAAFYPPASLISPKGQVRINADRLSFDQNGLGGAGVILWQNAASSLSPVEPLGDYRLDVTGEGKTANLKLATSRGALELSGQGKWQIQNGQLQMNGTAMPRERASELEPLLTLMGNDQGAGRRNFSLNAALPPAGGPHPR
jgi:general secretion pathway protein N